MLQPAMSARGIGAVKSSMLRKASVPAVISRQRCPLICPKTCVSKGNQKRRAGFVPRSTSAEVAASKADDASIAPLKVALQKAQARMEACTANRIKLEAQAQEIAQQAVEAEQAKSTAKENVFSLVAAIEAGTKLQASIEDKIHILMAKVEADANNMDARKELAVCQAQREDTLQQLASLRATLDDTYRVAVEAEASSVKAETVVAESMKAAEAAVKDEMQAAAVVKETLKALEKSSSMVPSEAPAPEAAAAAAAAAPTAKALSSMDGAEKAAAAAKAATAAATAAAATAAGPYPPGEEPGKGQGATSPAQVVFACVGVAVAWWLLTYTEPGKALGAAVMGVVDMAKHQLGHIHIHEAEKSLLEAICLLFTSCICVPFVVSKVPGGNPVLGYLLGGALVGPHCLGIIQDVKSVQHLAELGVVFLLFNIGLELSLDRLRSMAKFVFGMGSLQVLLTLMGVVMAAHTLVGLPIPSGVILGGALAMSSTAVGIQVLEDRGEMGSRHGRAIFSVLLLQDLAVVVLLMLIPLLAPNPSGAATSGAEIAKALGMAAVKAVACIVAIIAGGRLIVQPVYKAISSFANAELFSALTLLICLGTSFLTSLCGLSLALGAFLAGLLIAETEFALQVESDIAPYKGLLLGLFFMSVGMEISAQLFVQRWQEVIAGIVLLIGGKLAVMALIGPMFGLSKLASVRSGLLLAPGGEFAFVAFGEAVNRGVLPAPLTSVLYLVVALTMALIPYTAALGGVFGKMTEKSSTKALQPDENETKELKDHVIIAGYGRSGKLVAQLLSENHIPYVALDVRTDAVAAGRAQDLPVYFGDAGSPSVMHQLGAERASCAVIALDTPGANYRAVWAMTKHYPHVKTYVRAHDLSHALNLEKAGATAVVPETLEPSLQLAAAALGTMDFTDEDVSQIIDDYRRKHTKELHALTREAGTTVGYGFDKKDKAAASKPATGASLSSVSGSLASLSMENAAAGSSSMPPPAPAMA